MRPEYLEKYALAFLGKRYYFGGDDPISGFDCSGLACEMLRAAGAVPYSFRANAQTLSILPGAMRCLPQFGALSFYGKSEKQITHVGFCLDEITMVEAGGGVSSTLTDEAASNANAFVRIRPVRYRKDFLFCMMPGYA